MRMVRFLNMLSQRITYASSAEDFAPNALEAVFETPSLIRQRPPLSF